VKWSPAFATGVDRLDDQHKMLFNMSEDFRLALDHGAGMRVYGDFLKSLRLYARGHFGFEEQCMNQYECPVAHVNCTAHAHFVEALAEFQRDYATKGFDRADAHRLVDFLDAWLADHIGGIDVQLKPYAERAK
jgi:hemerythrin